MCSFAVLVFRGIWLFSGAACRNGAEQKCDFLFSAASQAIDAGSRVECPRNLKNIFKKGSKICGGGGCGGFFLACEDFGRMFDNSSPTPPLALFLKVEISSRILIPLFRPGSVHSGSANLDDRSRAFHDKLRVSSRFFERFPQYAWTA